MSVLTRYILIAGCAMLLMALSPIYERQKNKKAAKFAKIGSVLVLTVALARGIFQLIWDIGVFF